MFFKCALQGELFIETHVRRCFDVAVQGIIDIDVRLYTLLFPEKENRGREGGEARRIARMRYKSTLDICRTIVDDQHGDMFLVSDWF